MKQGRAVKHKNQHVIPNCYLKSWCDPRTPAGDNSGTDGTDPNLFVLIRDNSGTIPVDNSCVTINSDNSDN